MRCSYDYSAKNIPAEILVVCAQFPNKQMNTYFIPKKTSWDWSSGYVEGIFDKVVPKFCWQSPKMINSESEIQYWIVFSKIKFLVNTFVRSSRLHLPQCAWKCFGRQPFFRSKYRNYDLSYTLFGKSPQNVALHTYKGEVDVYRRSRLHLPQPCWKCSRRQTIVSLKVQKLWY